jgi:flagellar hook assembly protein FlgD
LVEPSQTTLIIYNLLGKRINLLINRAMDAGHHRAEWNGLDMSGQPVSSGVYFYELRSEKYIARKKMLLLR